MGINLTIIGEGAGKEIKIHSGQYGTSMHHVVAIKELDDSIEYIKISTDGTKEIKEKLKERINFLLDLHKAVTLLEENHVDKNIINILLEAFEYE